MGGDDWPDDWGGTPTADEATRRRIDELLSVLADRRRRDLLNQLSTVDAPDVETLVTRLVAAEKDVPPGTVSPEDHEQVELALVHRHLPKLDDSGAIEFDPRTGAIRFRGLPPILRRLIDPCSAIEIGE